MKSDRRSALTVLAAVLLAVAAPGMVPGAGWLVIPGLAAFYAVATSSSRPLVAGYAIGFSYFLAFSWSLRHVTWFGYVAIAVLGAVYFWLVV